jgi:hypothetical protein
MLKQELELPEEEQKINFFNKLKNKLSGNKNE